MEKKENNNGIENLHEWSNRMQGAREMLVKLYEDDKMILPLGVKRSEDRVYTKAIVYLLASDLRYVQEYLLGTNIKSLANRLTMAFVYTLSSERFTRTGIIIMFSS